MKSKTYFLVISEVKGGGYTCFCPDFNTEPIQGETMPEMVANAAKHLQDIAEDMIWRKQKLPAATSKRQLKLMQPEGAIIVPIELTYSELTNKISITVSEITQKVVHIQPILNAKELHDFSESKDEKINHIVLSKAFFSHLLQHPWDSNAAEWITDTKAGNHYLRFMQNFAHEEDENADLLFKILKGRSCTVTIETPIFSQVTHKTALYAYAVRNLCNCLFKRLFNTPTHKYDHFPILYGVHLAQEHYVMIWGQQMEFEESAQQREIQTLLNRLREMLVTPKACKDSGRTPIDENLIRKAFQSTYVYISGESFSKNPLSQLPAEEITGVQTEEDIIKYMQGLWKALTKGELFYGEQHPRRKNEQYYKPLSSDKCDQVREIILEELSNYIEQTSAIFLQYFDIEKASPDFNYDGIKKPLLADGWTIGFQTAVGTSLLEVKPSLGNKLLSWSQFYSIPEVCKAAMKCRADNEQYKRKISEVNLLRFLYEYFRKHSIQPHSTDHCAAGQKEDARRYPIEVFKEPLTTYRKGIFKNLYQDVIAHLDLLPGEDEF